MQKTFCQILSLFACVIFVGCSMTTSDPKAGGAPGPDRHVDNEGKLTKDPSSLNVTAISDTSKPNVFAPGDLNGIKKIEQRFSFNTGASTRFYFDPLITLSSCTTSPPSYNYFAIIGNEAYPVLPQGYINLPANRDVDLLIQVTDLYCSGATITINFGFRKTN